MSEISDLLELAPRGDSTAVRDVDLGGPLQPKPNPSELEVEWGVSQNLPFSVPFSGVAGSRTSGVEVLRSEEDEPTVRQLIAMRKTDGQARALYRLLTLPIRSALTGSSFVPVKGGEKEAAFIEQMFTLPPNAGGMTVTFQRVMAQMLMATFDGFAAFEQVYWQPKNGPLKGKYTLKKLAYRPAETVTFIADESGGFNGIRQKTTFQGRVVDVTIAPENCVYYAANEEERPFYGVSYFQSAFYHYDKKVKLYFIAHLAAQRAAVGTRKGTMPKNATTQDKNRFIRALADLGVAQHIALPGPDWAVDILKESGGFDFLSYINHHNSQMSKSILAAFFDSNQGSGGGDSSLIDFGQSDDSLFLLMLQTIMDEIAAVINHYVIPKFVDWNFGSGKYPHFKWGTFTDEQKKAIRKTFETLATAGQAMNVTPEFMFEIEKYMANEMGLDTAIDYDKIKKEKEEEKAKAKEQADIDRQALQAALNQPTPESGSVAEQGYGDVTAQDQQVGFTMPSLQDLAREILAEVHLDAEAE